MPIIKLTLSEDQLKRLTGMAGEKSVQQYLRELAFGAEEDPFTPQEAVRRIEEKIRSGVLKKDGFSLPDAYEEEEWAAIGRAKAGLLGKHFFTYVTGNPDTGIRFKENGRRTLYRYVK